MNPAEGAYSFTEVAEWLEKQGTYDVDIEAVCHTYNRGVRRGLACPRANHVPRSSRRDFRTLIREVCPQGQRVVMVLGR